MATNDEQARALRFGRRILAQVEQYSEHYLPVDCSKDTRRKSVAMAAVQLFILALSHAQEEPELDLILEGIGNALGDLLGDQDAIFGAKLMQRLQFGMEQGLQLKFAVGNVAGTA